LKGIENVPQNLINTYTKRIDLLEKFEKFIRMYYPGRIKKKEIPQRLRTEFQKIKRLVDQSQNEKPYFYRKFLFFTEETPLPTKITTKLFLEEKVFEKNNVVSTETEVYTKEVSSLLIRKINEFVEGDEKEAGFSVLLFGRTATGKTTFWQEFVKKFIEDEDYLKSVLGSEKTVTINDIETIGFYTSQAGKAMVFNFPVTNVVDLLLGTRNYKLWNLKTPDILQKNKGEYNAMVKIRWKKDGEQWAGDKYMDEYAVKFPEFHESKGADLSNIDIIKNVMLDDRMEVKRSKKTHLSTRNHIVKRIHFVPVEDKARSFYISFYVFAGSETAKKTVFNYGKPDQDTLTKIVDKEAQFLINDDLMIKTLLTSGNISDQTDTLKRMTPEAQILKKIGLKDQIFKGNVNFLLFTWPTAPDFEMKQDLYKEMNLYRIMAKQILNDYAPNFYKNFGPRGPKLVTEEIRKMIEALLVQ